MIAIVLQDNHGLIKINKTIISNYLHLHLVNSGFSIKKIKPPKVGNKLEFDNAMLEIQLFCVYLSLRLDLLHYENNTS